MVCRKIFVFSQKAIQSWSTDDLSQGGPTSALLWATFQNYSTLRASTG